MTSGADLFVVCKQCGSEVSPYVTECPYCGNRLRRRAPKLPRVNGPGRETAPARGRGLGSLLARARRSGARSHGSRWETSRPYGTIALVATGCVAWVASRAEPSIYSHTAMVGPLEGDWWKLLSSQLVYFFHGAYVFVSLIALSIFGWLFERRHGPLTMLALFFGAGVAGALAVSAVYSFPVLSGADGAALALLAAWAAPDLMAARAGAYYEGDLLAAGAVAALLLAMPFAYGLSEASWLACVVGGAIGLLVGLGLGRGDETLR
jgi:membrane associated rhomboid family serine protease